MVEENLFERTYYALWMTVNVTLSLVVMLAACLCCKKRLPKNELLGLEGMVKLKNPDDVVVVSTVNPSESQADLNLSTISNADSEKRASIAAHRSLPDIPVAETIADNGSELYETVADKLLMKAQNDQNKSPTASLKKQISVSQHSSISQADDVSSPYSRVKNSPHDYAKVRATEHPYAQLNPPSSSAGVASASHATGANATSAGSQVAVRNCVHSRNSQHSGSSSQNVDETPAQAEIPAASAIAGMISASQDLPYMTPPIANQHFSGDSQDSSKGYTSISVREPLATFLAQQPAAQQGPRNTPHSRDVNDSHYATVSDDSDETYAAIEDSNMRHNVNMATDIYTSGSETYAQIQPMQSSNAIVVAVEINSTSASTVTANCLGNNSALQQQDAHPTTAQSTSASGRPSSDHMTPVPPPVDSLKAEMHSRQASSSSNNSSSLCNLSSPKPEKRQANSPLPPTPKSNLPQTQTQTQTHTASSSSNLTSGRNSVISMIESGIVALDLNESGSGSGSGSAEGNTIAANAGSEHSPQRKNKSLSPSKDIEGMYAKVMKKNKFSRHSPSSQNDSPVAGRKYEDHISVLGVNPIDSLTAKLLDSNKINISICSTSDRSRIRSNSYSTTKDHGYETIPADAVRTNATTSITTIGGGENRKSDCYPNLLQKERLQEAVHTSSNGKPPIIAYGLTVSLDKHYETIANSTSGSNSDPGYETLLKPKNAFDADGEKKSSDYDPNYEVLKGPTTTNDSAFSAVSDDGYAKVMDKKHVNIDEDSTDGYSKVKGEENDDALHCDALNDAASGGYSTIAEFKGDLTADANHNYASILETKVVAADDPNEAENDHYARIAESHSATTPHLPLSSGCSKSMMDCLTPRATDHQSITSPTSITSSSLLSTSSAASSPNVTTISTSSLSSRQTPTSSTQYESLTGSDTDPNYESVCYINSGRENPYERLQSDYSDTRLNSPPSPEGGSVAATPGEHSKKITNANGSKQRTVSAESNVDILVNDYFQV